MLHKLMSNNTTLPELKFSDQLVDYDEAVGFMEQRVESIINGQAAECLWFLEHPPLYTAGTSAKPVDLLHPDRHPIYPSKRGGAYTYHGPGQRVVYMMLDLRRRGRDVRKFVEQTENWVIGTLADFNIAAHITRDRVGVWVPRPDKGPKREDKIAAIGLRIRRWVSFHGIAINVEPELNDFDAIVPCGISDQGVTSMIDLGYPIAMPELDKALIDNFAAYFPQENAIQTQS